MKIMLNIRISTEMDDFYNDIPLIGKDPLCPYWQQRLVLYMVLRASVNGFFPLAFETKFSMSLAVTILNNQNL